MALRDAVDAARCLGQRYGAGAGRSSTRLLDRHAGARGIVQLRRAVDLWTAAPNRRRRRARDLLLIACGISATAAQIQVCDVGYFIGRIDMGYEECKVGVEYDGPQHWTDPRRHARDIDRHAELHARGWMIMRVSPTYCATGPT